MTKTGKTVIELRSCNYTTRKGKAIVQTDLAWQARARCLEVDPEIFFPERGGSSRAARAVCAQCPVRIECLRYALSNREQFGIWGGTSERERRKLRRLAS